LHWLWRRPLQTHGNRGQIPALASTGPAGPAQTSVQRGVPAQQPGPRSTADVHRPETCTHGPDHGRRAYWLQALSSPWKCPSRFDCLQGKPLVFRAQIQGVANAENRPGSKIPVLGQQPVSHAHLSSMNIEQGMMNVEVYLSWGMLVFLRHSMFGVHHSIFNCWAPPTVRKTHVTLD